MDAKVSEQFWLNYDYVIIITQHQSELKGAVCKNWPPVELILQTIRGQHITRVTANFFQNIADVS